MGKQLELKFETDFQEDLNMLLKIGGLEKEVKILALHQYADITNRRTWVRKPRNNIEVNMLIIGNDSLQLDLPTSKYIQRFSETRDIKYGVNGLAKIGGGNMLYSLPRDFYIYLSNKYSGPETDQLRYKLRDPKTRQRWQEYITTGT